MSLSLTSWVLFAHILSATVLIGHSLFAPLVRSAVRRARTVDELRSWLDLGRRAARANPPASLVLLGTGLWLGSDGWWSSGWFWVAVAAWAVNVGLAAAVVQPGARSLGRAAARGSGPIGPELDALRHRAGAGIAQRAMTANDLALLFVMIETPSVLRSLAAIATFQVVVAGLALLARSRSGAKADELRLETRRAA